VISLDNIIYIPHQHILIDVYKNQPKEQDQLPAYFQNIAFQIISQNNNARLAGMDLGGRADDTI